MTLFVGEKSRPVVAQSGFHVLLENFFSLKKMAVAVNDHLRLSSIGFQCLFTDAMGAL
jgi:hypothetical protein